MSPSPSADRPRQVTVAGWLGIGASLAMVFSVFSWMSKLTTVDTRQALSDYLTKGSGRALGVDVQQALVLARVGLFVTGAAAAAMLVVAVFAMRRDKTSRVVMTALAAPILICGIFVDPFLAGFMLCAVVLVWTRPASDWFAGRRPQPAMNGPALRGPVPPAAPPAGPPPGPFSGPFSGQAAGYGPPPSGQQRVELPFAGPAPAGMTGYPVPARPVSVLIGGLVGAVLSATMAVLLVVSVVVLPSLAHSAEIRAQLEKQPAFKQAGMSLDELITMMQVMVAMAAVWALAAAVVAVLALLGHGWARILLTVSAGVAGLMSILFALSLPPLLLLTVGCVAAPVLLFRPEASQWYAARRGFARPVPHRPDRPW